MSWALARPVGRTEEPEALTTGVLSVAGGIFFTINGSMSPRAKLSNGMEQTADGGRIDPRQVLRESGGAGEAQRGNVEQSTHRRLRP